jgi:hypothetical protein
MVDNSKRNSINNDFKISNNNILIFQIEQDLETTDKRLDLIKRYRPEKRPSSENLEEYGLDCYKENKPCARSGFVRVHPHTLRAARLDGRTPKALGLVLLTRSVRSY